jgi:hypothetical protein
VRIPLLLTLAGCFFTLFYRVMKNRDAKAYGVPWLFLVPSVASLLFWFMAAPDPRYAGAAFWVLGAGAVMLAAQELGRSFNGKMSRCATFLCLALVASLIASEVIDGKAEALRGIIKENKPLQVFRHLSIKRDLILSEPGGDSGFYASPHVDLNTFVTHSGLLMYVPKNGKQCWDAPLPCARRPIPDLRLRQEGDMRSGFMCSDPEVIRKQDPESLSRNKDIEIDMCN